MSGNEDRAGAREWVGLAVLALPTLLVSLDMFVMLMALPQLGGALHASGVQQLWIVDVYGFMVAGFMVTMGGLGDRIGRRRLLLSVADRAFVSGLHAAAGLSAAILFGAAVMMAVVLRHLPPLGQPPSDPTQAEATLTQSVQ